MWRASLNTHTIHAPSANHVKHNKINHLTLKLCWGNYCINCSWALKQNNLWEFFFTKIDCTQQLTKFDGVGETRHSFCPTALPTMKSGNRPHPPSHPLNERRKRRSIYTRGCLASNNRHSKWTLMKWQGSPRNIGDYTPKVRSWNLQDKTILVWVVPKIVGLNEWSRTVCDVYAWTLVLTKTCEGRSSCHRYFFTDAGAAEAPPAAPDGAPYGEYCKRKLVPTKLMEWSSPILFPNIPSTWWELMYIKD